MSGVVPGYHNVERGPLMCYNSAAHITLGWFDDYLLDIKDTSSLQGPIRLAAFADYTELKKEKGKPEKYWNVLVRINDKVSFQYNRAKKHNSGVYEDADHVNIVVDDSLDATYELASLRPCNSTDVGTAACVYDSAETGRIEVCKVGHQALNDIDYAIVSITEHRGPSLCDRKPVPRDHDGMDRDRPLQRPGNNRDAGGGFSGSCEQPPEEVNAWLEWIAKVLKGDVTACPDAAA
jgi:hypothetical protein